MAKRRKGKPKRYAVEFLEDYERSFEEDFDPEEWSRDFRGKRRYDDFELEERFSARRRIERRNELKKLHSQLDDWEEFGSRYDF